MREALFSRLEARDVLVGARVLDLYAGSGALGLEAASRGAAEVLLVESARAVAAVARRNVAAVGLSWVCVRAASVERTLQVPATCPYDLVLIDPPYAVSDAALAAVLASLVDGGWLADDALVVVERSSRSPEPAWPTGLASDAVKKYGETTIWFAQRSRRRT